MKRFFGSPLLRLTRAGVVLRTGEYKIISAMLAELPDHLRQTVESQLNEYNLVQREADGRALNFYRVSIFSAKPLALRELLQGNTDETPLIRISVFAPGQAEPLHATLNAVGGRVFCASFSRPVPETGSEQELKVTKVTHAWQSNFPLRGGD